MSESNSRPPADPLAAAVSVIRDAPTPPGPPPELTAATLAAVGNRLAGLAPNPGRTARRRKIMRYVGFGTATAAAVAVAVTAGMFWSGGASAATRVQKALDNAAKAKSVTITATVENGGKVTHVRRVYRQGDKIRSESVKDAEHADDPPVTLGDLNTREALLLHPKAKTAHRIALGGQEVKLLVGWLDGRLAGIKALADGDADAVKALGEEKIGDRTTTVYAVKAKAPPGEWKVWVDPKTDHPVRLRLAGEGAKHTFTLDFADWNKEFDPKLFELEVPPGYREVKD